MFVAIVSLAIQTIAQSTSASQPPGGVVELGTTTGEILTWDAASGRYRARTTGGVMDVRDYGVRGLGNIDEHNQLNNAIAAVPNGSTLFCPAGFVIGVSGPVMFYNKRSIRFVSPGIGVDGSDGCVIKWIGGHYGGAVVEIQRSRDMVWDDISVASGHDSSLPGATIGIWLAQNYGNGNITTNNEFSHGSVHQVNNERSWTGVKMGDSTGQNVEFMKFRHFSVSGTNWLDGKTRIGFDITHFNTKSETFEDISGINLSALIRTNYGSFTARFTHGYAVETVYFLNHWTEPIVIENDNWEMIRQIMVVSIADAHPVTLAYGRYEALRPETRDGTYPIFDLCNGYYSFHHNSADSIAQAYKTYGGNCGANTHLEADHNSWDTTTDAGLVNMNVFRVGNTIGGRSEWRWVGWDMATTDGTPTHFAYQRRTENAPGPLGQSPCKIDALCIGFGEIEIEGIPSVTVSATATVTGPGSAVRVFYIVPKDKNGRRGPMYWGSAYVRNAPDRWDEHHAIHLSWYPAPRASSYDILVQKPGDNSKWHLVANIGTTYYTLLADPLTKDLTYEYTPPAANETGGVLVRDNLQIMERVSPPRRHAGDFPAFGSTRVTRFAV